MTDIPDDMETGRRLVPPPPMKNFADIEARSKKIQGVLHELDNIIYNCFGRLQKLKNAIDDRDSLTKKKMLDMIDTKCPSMNCSKLTIMLKLHCIMGNNRALNEERLSLINLMPEVFGPANVLSIEGCAKTSMSFYTSLQGIFRKFFLLEKSPSKASNLTCMVSFNTLLQKAFNAYTKTLEEKASEMTCMDSGMGEVDSESLWENIHTHFRTFRRNKRKVSNVIAEHYKNLLQPNKSDEVHMETSKIIRSLLGEQMLHSIRMFELCSKKLLDFMFPEKDMSDKVNQDIIFLLTRSIREVDRIAREMADQVVPVHTLYDIVTDTFEVFGGVDQQSLHIDGSLRVQCGQYQSGDEKEWSESDD